MNLLSRRKATLAAGAILIGSFGPARAQDKINGDRDSRNPGAIADSGTPGRSTPWTAPPAGYSAEMVQQWASTHAASNPGYQYVFVPPTVASNKELSNILRVAAGKAWNHLSWMSEVDLPVDISGGHGLAFGLNTGKVWSSRAAENWGVLANCSPKPNISVSPAPRGACQAFSATQPVEIPRFVFNATNGGPYANIHQTPPYYDAFARRFQLGAITATSTHKEAIVCGPRITAYRDVVVNGVKTVYAFTSDEFNGRDNGNINYQSAPTEANMRRTGAFTAAPNDDNTAIASEWWLQLPNGFIYYGIHGEGSQERGKAEFPFAIDPANWTQGADLTTGRSCITCHANGIQAAVSDAEFAGRNGWTSNDQLQSLYLGIRTKFQAGMRALVAGLSDGEELLNQRLVDGSVEPISRAILLIEGPYRGSNFACSSFCNGKFGLTRGNNLCQTIPAK